MPSGNVPERSGRSVAFVRHDARRRVRVAAWPLAGFTACVLVAAIVLAALNASRLGTVRTGADLLLAVAVGVGVATSQLIISRRPGNAIGWLLGLIELSLAASMFTDQYALYGLATASGSLPAARTAGWAAGVLATVTVMLLAFLMLLFPDGRLPSRRWRPVLSALVVVTLGWVAGQFQAGTTVTAGITDALSAADHVPLSRVLPASRLAQRHRPGGLRSRVAARCRWWRRYSSAARGERRTARAASLAGLRRPDDRHLGRGAGGRGIRGARSLRRLARHAALEFPGVLPVPGVPLACAVAKVSSGCTRSTDHQPTLAYAIVTAPVVGLRAGAAGQPRCSGSTRRWRWPPPRWRRRHCSAAAARCSQGGRRFNRAGMTRTRPWPRSRPLKDAADWIRSEMTWPRSCNRPWNPPTCRCGSANATQAGFIGVAAIDHTRLGAASLIQPIQDRHDVTASQPPLTRCGREPP